MNFSHHRNAASSAQSFIGLNWKFLNESHGNNTKQEQEKPKYSPPKPYSAQRINQLEKVLSQSDGSDASYPSQLLSYVATGERKELLMEALLGDSDSWQAPKVKSPMKISMAMEKDPFAVINPASIKEQDAAVEAAEREVEGAIDKMNAQLEGIDGALEQRDKDFWSSLATLTGGLQERRDSSQMQVAEVMEDLCSVFELTGRKMLTCDSLIQKRNAKQREAFESLAKDKTNLQRQRLEKKREHAFHKESNDVAHRENSALQEELAKVQQTIDQTQRNLLLKQCELRREARRNQNGGP